MTIGQVSLVLRPPGGLFLELDIGAPQGGDTIHRTISAWAGWRRCPQIGAHHGQPTSRYQARAWLAALQPLLTSTFQLAWAPEARKWCEEQVRAYQRRDWALQQERTMHDGVPWIAADHGRPPMPHQTQALEALAEQGGQALLGDDMGLGKTTTAVLAWLFKGAGPRRALVICPKSVKLNWQDEVQACYGVEDSQIPGRTVPLIYLIDGTPAHRANVIGYMRAAIDENSLAIAIVNYDLLRSMNELAWKTLEAWCAGQCVIADEFHYCKDRNSKRTKAVQTLMGSAVLRLGLTGTPVRNTVEDLFAQIELLRPGTWVSYHDFANRHLVISQAQFGNRKRPVNIVRGGKNLEELNRVVNTLLIARKKEDVLSLPPLIRTKPQLELDGLHLDVYKAMKDFARVELEKLIGQPTLVAPPRFDQDTDLVSPEPPMSMWHPLARSAVEAAMRCEMIAQGFLSGLPEQYAEKVAPMIAGKAERVEGYPNAFVFPDSPKMAWLLEVVENQLANRQVVIFSRFNAPILWLEKRLDSCCKLIGSMDTVARQETLEAFRKEQKRIIVVQVKMAEGFNLTGASDEIFLGRDWSPAINAQAEARCHRIGSKGTVNVQIPIVRKTVEMFIDKRLAAKDADAQQALKAVTIRELLEAL